MIFPELNPETPAQREIADKIEKLGGEMAAWLIVTGKRDHRLRPEPSEAPQHKELIALIRQFCKLKEQGL